MAKTLHSCVSIESDCEDILGHVQMHRSLFLTKLTIWASWAYWFKAPFSFLQTPAMRFLLLCAWPLCWAARQKIPKTKIACVGDSLTAGYPFDSGRGDDPAVSGYPYHLQRLLDEDAYEARSFPKRDIGMNSLAAERFAQTFWVL